MSGGGRGRIGCQFSGAPFCITTSNICARALETVCLLERVETCEQSTYKLYYKLSATTTYKGNSAVGI